MKKRIPIVQPLLLAGVLIILVPIFTMMTLDRLKRQKEFFNQRLMERGVALIRTFEAGTRTGMLTMRWGAHRIQTMLYETSLQPDVLYLFITDKEGKILAHSDADQAGTIFTEMPDTGKMANDPGSAFSRMRVDEVSGQSFEIYKRFVPIRPPGFHGMRHGGMRGGLHRRMAMEEDETAEEGDKDWSRPYAKRHSSEPWDGAYEPPEHYIFAGLSMEKETFARQRFVRQTIWRTVVFFVLGCLGIVALLAFQAYRSAQKSLTRVKAFSDNVIHHMPSGLVTIDPENRVSSMNQAARDILDGDIEPSFGPWKELMAELMRSEKTISREMTVETASGRTVLLDVTASSIKDAEGRITEFLFLFKDLTQVQDLKKQVETNRRLAAIGKLAAGVAHEIRNPLSSIKGFATYFGKKYSDSETDQQTAEVMVSEVERINQSISQLLEFAKPMAVEKRPVNVREMIEHSLTLVKYDLEKKHIRSQVTVETALDEILTDAGRINQVLLNLYINAVQAVEKDGELFIRVKDAADEGTVDIEVEDTGRGIAPEDLDHIFDPYFTTRPTGTGLGLSIVHRIIENLGGTIRVKSEKDKGTCFTISIPSA